MKFTPSQVRSVLAISEETLRYWKRKLTPLSEKRGHAPCYTHGELLSLAVVSRLVRDFRMDVAALEKHSQQLFSVCHQSQWPKLAEAVLAIGAEHLRVHQGGVIKAAEFTEPCVVLPLGLILDELKASLVAEDGDTQLELGFPPVPVVLRMKRG